MNKTDHKNNPIYRLFYIVYSNMDYWMPCLVVLTFPFWLLPALTFFFFSKTISLTKYLFSLLHSFLNPNQIPQLCYAILKGNGRYLREDSDHVLINQFYDYTARRFMSVGELEHQTRILEIECDNEMGLHFLMENNRLGTVAGIQSNADVLKHSSNTLGMIVGGNYHIESPAAKYDCMLLFNFKAKSIYNRNKQRPDLLTILTYCLYHLESNGYLVYGDYFEKGELATFISLFEAYNLRVVDQEDLTKNIDYARKLIKQKNSNNCEQKLFDSVLKRAVELLGRKPYDEGRQFNVFILERAEEE